MAVDGDVVEAGQLLVKLDRTKAETAYLEARAKAAGLGATVARLHAEIGDRDPVFKPELRHYPEFRENQLLLRMAGRAARLGAFSVSQDHSKLAYSLDREGDEIYRLFVKDLASGDVTVGKARRRRLGGVDSVRIGGGLLGIVGAAGQGHGGEQGNGEGASCKAASSKAMGRHVGQLTHFKVERKAAMSAICWSLKLCACACMVGCLRLPFLYSCSALPRYSGDWPPILGTWKLG